MKAAPKIKPSLAVKAYRGDAKTLLAFDLPKSLTRNLAGFTIQCQPPGLTPYYIHNELQFATPSNHAQDPKEPPYSSINAPVHKFRWLHVPGQVHQGLTPAWGQYTYTVTPRYFDETHSMLPLDSSLSVPVSAEVGPFESERLAIGFTRGYTQSQAFVRHFGLKASIKPPQGDLVFDTAEQSGTNAQGQKYSYLDEYQWLGYTARQRIFDILNEVINDKSLRLDMFAYDLNEPDLIQVLLALAKQGRIRVILDNAALHHTKSGSKTKAGKPKAPTAEDQFERLFDQAKKGDAAILRGCFARYSHDKVLIVYDGNGAMKVLTGSTNFSVTGLYVNSNHVLVFEDRKVAAQYAKVFNESWNTGAKAPEFRASPLSAGAGFTFSGNEPRTLITFSPHTSEDAQTALKRITDRLAKEEKAQGGNVLFAVMELASTAGKSGAKKGASQNPVYDALNALHADGRIFSYGISDDPKGISLYKPGNKTGVLVTGKPVQTQLPPPFNQVPGIGGIGHQIHHKFVVCGFNGDDPVVFCGSSNLAMGGEQANGDNLLMIQDEQVATVFVIEALALVDHFDFLDRYAQEKKKSTPREKTNTLNTPPPAMKQQAATSVGWHLSTDDKWVGPYYDSKDLKCADRQLFA